MTLKYGLPSAHISLQILPYCKVLQIQLKPRMLIPIHQLRLHLIKENTFKRGNNTNGTYPLR